MIGNRAQRLIGRTVVTAAIVGAIVVLILIYVRSGGNGTGAGAITPATPRSSPSRSGGTKAAGGESGAPPKSLAGGATGAYTGPVVGTPYGPVQVAVAERAGRIAEVKALQLPTEHPQSLFISERVAPLLREEVLQAQSARINIVSGATFTSEGYAESLQQALSHIH